MAVKRARDDGVSHHTVFVSTSLLTKFALIVSDSDSVSDLKQKIVQEHLSHFPEMNDLKISRVKVQRKGSYYYLPDPMLLKSAFEHIKRDWFVYVDASNSQGNGLCITYPQTDQTGPFKTMAKPSVIYTIPDRSLNPALTETPEDKSVRADTAHNNSKKRKRKKKKKGNNSSMCHDEVAYVVPSSTGNVEGNKRSKINEGVEMKIFDKPTDVDSTIHVTQSGPKQTDEGQKELSTKLGSIVPQTGVEHKNEIGKDDNSLITQVAETSLPLDNNKNKVTGETKEQTLSAEKTSDGKVELESGNASSIKQKEKRHKRSAENIRGKLDGEDEQRKKGENLLDAGKVQMDSVQAQSADTKAEMTIKEVENVSVAPSDVKVAGGHINSGRSKKRRTKKDEVSASTDGEDEQRKKGENLSDAGKVQMGSVQAQSADTKAEMIIKEVENVSVAPSDVKVAGGHRNSGRSKKRTRKDEVSASTDVPGAPLDAQGSNQDNDVSPATEGKGELVPVEEKGIENWHLLLNHTDKDQESERLVQKKPIKKTKKSQSPKKSKCITTDQLDNTKLESPGTDSNLQSSGEVLGNADSFRVPPHSVAKGTLEEMHSDKSENIDFKQYFVPVQQESEVDSKKSTKSTNNTKVGCKSSRSVEADKTLEEAGKHATHDASTYKKERKESIDEPMYSSSSKGSDRLPEQAAPEIQSLATRNTKTRSKKDERSDSSTYTPSDDSSSSDYSVDESDISQASTPTGGDGAKSKGAGAKPKAKPNLSGEKMSMDLILRRSSRFKKAKVTAAQCLDEESQPVDVVPDSQAEGLNQ